MGDDNGMNTVQEYDIPVVVLSGGLSAGFMPMNDVIPKALFRIGNRSLICGTLDNLTLSGFRDIRIVTGKECLNTIEEHVKIEFLAPLAISSEEVGITVPKVTFYGLLSIEDERMGTADVIKHVFNSIDGHFMVITCDIYGFFDFKGLLKEHFKTSRICTIALLESCIKGDKATEKQKSKPLDNYNISFGRDNFNDWSYNYRVIATLDEHNSQIVGLVNSVAIENGESYKISKFAYLKHPRCSIRFDLVDLHVYVFSKHIFNVIRSEKFTCSTIRLDLIPYIIKMQETPASHAWIHPEEQSIVHHSEPLLAKEIDSGGVYDSTRVFYFLMKGDSSKCCRVNSLESLLRVNLQKCQDCTHKAPTFQKCGQNVKVKGAIMGHGCHISDQVNIKTSVMGLNVKIGKYCKVTNCIIMDDCVVEEGAILDRSIIGKSATIEAKTKLKNTVVLPNHTVPCGANVENDFIPSFVYG